MITTRPDRLLLPALVTATCIHGAVSSSAAVAVSGMTSQFGPSAGTSVVLAAFTGAAVAAPAAGRLADRFGPRRLLQLGLGVVVVASLLAATAGSLGVLIVARTATGAGTAALFPGAIALLARINTAADRPAWVGCSTIVWTSEVAFGAGPVLGGVLVGAGGWRACCLLGVPTAVLALTLLRTIPDQPTATPAQSPPAGGYATFDDDTDRSQPWRTRRVVAAVLTRIAAQYIAVYVVIYGAPLYLQQHGTSAAAAGAIVLPLAAVSAGTVVVSARRSAQLGGPRGLLLLGIAAVALAAVGLSVAARTGSTTAVLAVCCVIGAASASTVANTRVLLAAVPTVRSGSVAGWARSTQFVAGQAAALLTGALGASTAAGLLSLATVLTLTSAVLAVATTVVPQGVSS